MATLTVKLKDRELKNLSLGDTKLMIGRSLDCDVVLDNIAVSREHASIEFAKGNYILVDLGSANGTLLNGLKISKSVTLSSNDSIQIGKFELLFQDFVPNGSSSASPGSMEKTMVVEPKQPEALPPSSREMVARQLTLVAGKASKKQISLEKNVTTIGKGSVCDVVLSGLFISKVQAVVLKKEGKYYILDKGSMVSTRLNGYKIEGDTLLVNGDTIQIGRSKLRFS